MRRFLFVVFMAVCAATARAKEPCKLERFALIPFKTDVHSMVLVPATLAGRKTHLLVDTGGIFSVVREELVDELRLRKISTEPFFYDGAGKVMTRYVRVPSLTLGDIAFGIPFDFLVGNFGGTRSLDEVGGTMGANFLTGMDLEIDNAGKTISLFRPNRCGDNAVYWADSAVTLNIRGGQEGINMPIVEAQLAGERVRTLFDTGASLTSMSLRLAERKFGITPTSPGAVASGQMVTATGKRIDIHQYTFPELTFGGVRFENVRVQLGKFDDGDIDLVLGMREMRHLRLYFALRGRKVYITAADAGRAPAP